MNVNPYAAPGAELPKGPSAPHRGEPQPWDVGEVLRAAWGIYKTSWAPLSFGFFGVALMGMLPGQLAPGLGALGIVDEAGDAYMAITFASTFVGWVVQEFFAIGLTRMALSATRSGVVSFAELFSGGPRLLPFLVLSFLKTLAIMLGLIVLVVPGVVLALGFWMSRFYMIDQGLGPLTSLRASWDATEGHKANLLLLALAAVVLTMVGVMACCVGLFVTEPVFLVALTIVYLRLSGTAPLPPPQLTSPPYAL
jgi:uncharacterized membrane protein